MTQELGLSEYYSNIITGIVSDVIDKHAKIVDDYKCKTDSKIVNDLLAKMLNNAT